VLREGVKVARKARCARVMRGVVVAAAVAATGLAPLPVTAQEATPPAGALEQQLQQQRAMNAALRGRIAKLETALKSDVCVDPAAAQALLDEGSSPIGAVAPRENPAD